MTNIRFKNLLNIFIAGFIFTSVSLSANTKPITSDSVSLISKETELLTVVNVITPKQGQQDEIIKLLQRGMVETMQFQDGFISANIHKSLDSEHVLVYAQWESASHLQAAVDLIMAGKAPNMAKVFTSANPDFHPYDVVSIHHPAPSQ